LQNSFFSCPKVYIMFLFQLPEEILETKTADDSNMDEYFEDCD